jgi:hypothetical protein
MKKRRETKRGRLTKEIKFFLGKNQTLYVDPNPLFGPGLDRIFVRRKNGKVEVRAQATSGSHFRFRRGSGKQFDPDFQIRNLDFEGTIADILDRKFWGQFHWGQLAVYVDDNKFTRTVKRLIKQLAVEFESHAAKELNAIPRPKRSKPSMK